MRKLGYLKKNEKNKDLAENKPPKSNSTKCIALRQHQTNLVDYEKYKEENLQN